MSDCAACRVAIPGREFLMCFLCKNKYDLDCANVPSKRFYNIMTKERKSNWTCKSCCCNTRKVENSNTRSQIPLPKATAATIQEKKQSFRLEPSLNMSLRPRSSRNKHTANNSNDSSDVEDQFLNDHNISGDTVNTSTMISPKPTPNRPTNTLCLEDFRNLLDEKLETYKQNMISEIKSIIQSEINSAINHFKADILQRTEAISSEQTRMKSDILDLTEKIQTMETENKNLETDLKNIRTTILSHKSLTNTPADTTGKKIVLHGLEEMYGETELDLQERLLHIFRDIMNTNLYGYIEDLRRIGKRGNKRPLVIELLSKSMTRYLLQNSEYFQNTGLSITEYLDEESLKIRRNLKNALSEARRVGKHAIIRNNKLIINGTEYTHEKNEPSRTTDCPTSDYPTTGPIQPTQSTSNNNMLDNQKKNRHTFRP
jgi:hypothetical protein